MNYFKKQNGSIWYFDDDQLDFVKPEMVEMSDDEVEAHINPKPTLEQLSTEARNKRDALLLDSQWLVQRHRDQLDAGIETTLTVDEYVALLQYRQDLRDIPGQIGFPTVINWPIAP